MRGGSTTEATAAVLGRSAVFDVLSERGRATLVQRAGWVTFDRRELLYRQGERGGTLFLIRSGRIRLVRQARGDRELTLAYRASGELVGEELFSQPTHRYDAKVVERVEALSLPHAAVQSLVREEVALAAALHGLEVSRRLSMEARLEALLTRTVESRVAEFLTEAATRHGVPEPRGVLIGVKMTHQEIASYVGSTRETVTLILGDLKRRGLIAIDHRRIVVCDGEGLARLA